jgi:hypothetical protein
VPQPPKRKPNELQMALTIVIGMGTACFGLAMVAAGFIAK